MARVMTVQRGKAFGSAVMVVVKARVSSFISMKNRSRTTPFIGIFFVLVLDVDSTSTCVPFWSDADFVKDKKRGRFLLLVMNTGHKPGYRG
jgi:hypothetical protein